MTFEVVGRWLAKGRGGPRLYSMILLPILVSLFASEGRQRPAMETNPVVPPPAVEKRVIELRPPASRLKRSTVSSPATLPTTVTPRPMEREQIPGQYAMLEGRVFDERTGTLLAGAEVSVPEVDLRVVTGSDGSYRLEGIPPRDRAYEVLVTRPGYKSLFADYIFKAGEKVVADQRLSPIGW